MSRGLGKETGTVRSFDASSALHLGKAADRIVDIAYQVPRRETMDRNTFDSTIRAFKHRSPYQPFTVAMANGDRLEVEHADAIVVRDGVGVFIATGGVPVILDHEGVSQIIGDLTDQPAH